MIEISLLSLLIAMETIDGRFDSGALNLIHSSALNLIHLQYPSYDWSWTLFKHNFNRTAHHKCPRHSQSSFLDVGSSCSVYDRERGDFSEILLFQ